MSKLNFKLPQDTFNKLALLVSVVLVVAVVVFALLNASSNLHVRSLELTGSSTSAEVEGQKLTVHFNRPLQKDTVDKALYVSPAAAYVISWQGNDLIINFKDNLQSDISYTFGINTTAQDVYHTSLIRPFVYQFHTKKLKLVYLENHDHGTDSRIIRVDPDFTNPQELYTAQDIVHFDISKRYLAVVISSPDQLENKLVIKDLRSNAEREIQFTNQRVNKAILSPNGTQMALIVQNLRTIQGTLVPDSGSKIRVYNLNDLSYQEVNPQDAATEVGDIVYSPAGDTILFKTTESSYYIADINNPDNLVILSKHLVTNGFNRQADKILFIDFDPLATYSSIPYISIVNSDKSATRVSGSDNYVIDPQFFNNQDRIIFAQKYKDLDGTKGLFKIMIGDLTGKELTLYVDSTHSLELPKLSKDDRYVVVERYNPEDMTDYSHQRDFQFQTKPPRATLVVIDLLTGTINDKDINGIDAQWQP